MKVDTTREHVTDKSKKVKQILGCWGYSDLSLIGIPIFIKPLAHPIMVQSLTTLPNPPPNIMNEIQTNFINSFGTGN